MLRDHYVSQVHLKNFYSPKLGRLHAIRKSDLKAFSPSAKDVCHSPNGSSNDFLPEPRCVEFILKEVEPRYNWAIRTLESGQFDPQAMRVVAQFAAYVISCSPTAMRLGQTPLKAPVETVAEILHAQGIFPPSPVGRSLPELIHDGEVVTTIDPKFPQAIGINVILGIAEKFCQRCSWELLRIPYRNTFFTSDFPVAIEKRSDERCLNRIVPLSPTLAVRIKPQIGQTIGDGRLNHRVKNLTPFDVKTINTLIVRCAEDLVFYSRDEPWISKFIKKHREARIEATMEIFPVGQGKLHLSGFTIAGKR